jgi:hypothetical protein
MRSPRKVFAPILLALVLGAPAFAGDMDSPPSVPPAPVKPASAPAPDNSETPSVPAEPSISDELDPSRLAFDLLCRVLSIY